MRIHLRRVMTYWAGITAITLTGVMAVYAASRVAQWPERLSGLAINMGDIGRVRPGIVDIFILRWSAPDDTRRLVNAFTAGGPDALRGELVRGHEVGYLRTPDNRTYSVYFAWDEPRSSGGRRMVLATARRLKFWEAAMPRSNTNEFTLIEIRLNRDGRGEGKMSLTTKVAVSEELDLIELADYANEPARLLFTP